MSILSRCVAVMLFIPLLAGCLSAEPGESIVAPWPTAGEVATYHGPRVISIRVDGLSSVNDVTGTPVEVLALRIQVSMTDRITHYWEYVDGDGAKALAAAPCFLLGAGSWKAPESCPEGRTSGTYLEHEMPAALSMSRLWGRPLLPGEMIAMPYRMLTSPLNVTYEVHRHPLPDCVLLQAIASPQVQYREASSLLLSPVTRLVVCAGESFPRQMEWESERYERTETAQGHGDPLVPRGQAANPNLQPPSAEILPVLRGIPPRSDREPTGFPIGEAIRALREHHDTRDHFQQGKTTWVRSSVVLSGGAGNVLVVTASVKERTLVMERSDGVGLHAVLRKECMMERCAIEVIESSTAHVRPSDQPIHAVGYDGALREAARLMEKEPYFDSVTTIRGNGDGPAFLADRTFLYAFFGTDGTMFPLRAEFDGRTGLLLYFDVPDASAEKITGFRWSRT